MKKEQAPISAVLTDVDGTLLTKDKVLTARAVAAVNELRERGIVFTITSGRPPFGMRMLVEPLGLKMPMAAINGGILRWRELAHQHGHPMAKRFCSTRKPKTRRFILPTQPDRMR